MNPDGLIVIGSLYRGYTDTGEYTDIEHNLSVAKDILADYWAFVGPAISLVLQWGFLGVVPAEEEAVHKQAQEWCLQIVAKADEIHFYYPTGMGLSRGMRIEWERARQLGIPVREFEREW